jgi:hypothetical protein
MKPKPFASLNHFTVPFAIVLLLSAFSGGNEHRAGPHPPGANSNFVADFDIEVSYFSGRRSVPKTPTKTG